MIESASKLHLSARPGVTFDREIDRLVFKLYELTDEEIAIVEGSTRR